jgi:hypothetical protein
MRECNADSALVSVWARFLDAQLAPRLSQATSVTQLFSALMLESELLPSTYSRIARQPKERLPDFLDRYEARQEVLRHANVVSTMGVEEFIQAANLDEATIVGLLNAPRASISEVITFLHGRALVRALQGRTASAATTDVATVVPQTPQRQLDRRNGACYKCHNCGATTG